jgi:rod shape-determining protein MreB and related proteins
MPGVRIGIDFGSSNITLCQDDKGIIISEPSIVICDRYTNKPVAVGRAAKKMKGKIPASMRAVYPINDGIVNDYDMACRSLKFYLDRLCRHHLLRPNVLMSVPSTVTELERKTILDVIYSAGAGCACFLDEALASAIGAGVSLREPRGTFVCDIGGGTTDCAVVTMGNIAVSKCVKVGGNIFTDKIREYILHEHNINIGFDTADEIKKTVGTAVFRNEEVAFIAGGKNTETGLPVLFEITSTEVYWILKPCVDEILSCIRSVLEITPPELVSDIAENGIILTGGTAKLFGLDKFIEKNTGIRTYRAPHPEKCAALGLERMLGDMKYLENNGYVFRPGDEQTDE